MSRFAAALGILLALAIVVPTVLGQELTAQEYQKRRQQLEREYLAAETPEEKERVWEEFRKMELAHTGEEAGSGKKVASPGGSGSTGVDPAILNVIDALAKSLTAVVDFVSPGGVDPGLGAGGGNAPLSSDWRVDELVAHSKLERGRKATLLEVGYEEVDDIAVYNEYYDEVGAWLDLAAQGHDFEDSQLDSWAWALTNLGKKRRAIAGRMASEHWQDPRNAAAKRLANHRKTLAKQNQSLAKVLQAFQNADDMKAGVEEALKLKDRLSTLENILGLAADPSKIAAVGAGVSEFFNQVDPVGDAINKHVATIAAYVKKQAAQLEGYESLQDLLNHIRTTVAAIESAAGDLDFYVKKYRTAVALEAAPIYAKSW